ncbi:MAG: LptF/LptG family permease [Mailhella sp.]|nr:LptF/LptG family permease [Mailhella sp.]
MSVLSRYIFRNHARLMFLTIGIGIALFILTDLLEKIDTLSESGLPMSYAVLYFAARIPGILAQILPAVFLLASVILLCLLESSRESMALQAGGISPLRVVFVLACCGALWSAGQFACSQVLAGAGDSYAEKIWREQVLKKKAASQVLRDVWFMDRGYIVELGSLNRAGKGRGFKAYVVDEGGREFSEMITAESFTGKYGEWKLSKAVRVMPKRFERESVRTLTLPIERDPSIFFAAGRENMQQMSFWNLRSAIESLRKSGSNVEGLVTAMHGKAAYAVSVLVLAFVAAALVSWKKNIYLAVTGAIVVTFLSYVATVFGTSLGEKGMMPPALASWMTNILLFALSWLRLWYVSVRR